jgi:hypothetical protein
MLMNTDTIPEVTTETFVCSKCGDTYTTDKLNKFDGQTLCNECFNEFTVTCTDCNTRIWEEVSHHDDYIYLCRECYDRGDYRRCYDCDCLIRADNSFLHNGDTYCEDCYNDIEDYDDEYEEDRAIHSYDYKPEPIFYGEGIHYGIELEVDKAGESADNAWKVLDVGNYDDDHIYIKHDGSLSDGFEIVSHPMSLSYHQDKMNWQKVLNKLIELGYRSHKTDTCGYHIHVEKARLGDTFECQETTISNILYFVERHWNELLKFSRRTPKQMKAWASRYGYKDSPKEMLDHAKRGSWSRYVCINLLNRHTIEFRMFRGTLKYSTLIAVLQMVDSICNTALSLSEDELKSLSWTEFVGAIDTHRKSELVEYLKFKRLYVNEPIEGQEDL